ncbi:response regulator transcription factor [Serpentinicella alkaliphila]|uniref:Stage 0 sporulation protein A homolog n=1 Tax=Serpentinicella alkaliphila TaxID=1734049 RepID=A0A4R2THK5_9FIRM|nr:response regulator transcription factor [Serpentinicella alkaliphila]QUH26240.1 response regulator transcription factor [Serpentinicella alkaliphila]TCQ01702.1 DNA-binding response OmpR family regulator [Serpentinicella alkaliphila]
MKKILIIEDDYAIAKIERDFLMINGYEAIIIEDGERGLQEALKGKYDLIILDLMLPGKDGLEICKQIRNVLDIPILMVTAKIENVDKIMGLGLGADDYIAKPFSPTELVARVKANLAQYERISTKVTQLPKTEEIVYGNLYMNTQARRVYLNGKEIDFKNKEYELLYFLMSNPENVFSREVLYERIWGMDALGDSRTVSVHINRLREKIELDPTNPERIQTVWGAGYRFKP